MILGLRTVVYNVNNIEKAKEWYQKVLAIEPYFDRPFYVGFNVSGFELGLTPTDQQSKASEEVIAYWGVEDIEESFNHLIKLGAQEHDSIKDVGDGILVASVIDPFGNIFGIIHNPHFKIKEKS